MNEITVFTRTEHRILQTMLHLPGPISAEVVMMAIEACGVRKRPPWGYIYDLRQKLKAGCLRIRTTPGGYLLQPAEPRDGPLRDRAQYMKDYRARVGRPSRARIRK